MRGVRDARRIRQRAHPYRRRLRQTRPMLRVESSKVEERPPASDPSCGPLFMFCPRDACYVEMLFFPRRNLMKLAATPKRFLRRCASFLVRAKASRGKPSGRWKPRRLRQSKRPGIRSDFLPGATPQAISGLKERDKHRRAPKSYSAATPTRCPKAATTTGSRALLLASRRFSA